MTIDEFTNSIDFPKMKLLGKMKNFKYYTEAHIKTDVEEGEPIIIEENLISNKFKVCDSEQTFAILKYFGGKNG